jgi:hypothetical protein
MQVCPACSACTRSSVHVSTKPGSTTSAATGDEITRSESGSQRSEVRVMRRDSHDSFPHVGRSIDGNAAREEWSVQGRGTHGNVRAVTHVQRPVVLLGKTPLSIENVAAIADGRATVAIDPDPHVRARIASASKLVEDALANGRTIYGVTTGFGASVEFQVSPDVAARMPINLVRYHGCGTGELFGPREAAAIVAVRASSLSLGASAVRQELLDRLCLLVDRRIVPCIPEEGSVGASGDLTPLSYVAALLAGEREAWGGWSRRLGAGGARGARRRAARPAPQGVPRDHERHERDERARSALVGAREEARAHDGRADRDGVGRAARRARSLRRPDLRAQAAPRAAHAGALDPRARVGRRTRRRASRTATRSAARRTSRGSSSTACRGCARCSRPRSTA